MCCGLPFEQCYKFGIVKKQIEVSPVVLSHESIERLDILEGGFSDCEAADYSRLLGSCCHLKIKLYLYLNSSRKPNSI